MTSQLASPARTNQTLHAILERTVQPLTPELSNIAQVIADLVQTIQLSNPGSDSVAFDIHVAYEENNYPHSASSRTSFDECRFDAATDDSSGEISLDYLAQPEARRPDSLEHHRAHRHAPPSLAGHTWNTFPPAASYMARRPNSRSSQTAIIDSSLDIDQDTMERAHSKDRLAVIDAGFSKSGPKLLTKVKNASVDRLRNVWRKLRFARARRNSVATDVTSTSGTVQEAEHGLGWMFEEPDRYYPTGRPLRARE